MAEPSLQLGNGNWAGKSGNLLAYHKANNNFYADELTFARASTGTIVNADGLIEEASVISTTEEVTNGNFATDSDWTKETGWSIAGGNLIATSVSGTAAYQVGSGLVSGKKYQVQFEITEYTTGAIGLRAGTGATLQTFSSIGVHYADMVAGGALQIRFDVSGTTTLKVDNVSVKEVITSNVPRVSYLNNANGSLLLESQRTNLVPYSQEFSNSDWGKNSSGIDTSIGNNGINENIAISPDGTLNSDRVNFLLQSDLDLGIGKSISSSSGTTWSASVWIKGEGSNIGKNIGFRLKRSSGGSYIGNDGTIELTSEWVRIEINPLTLIANNNGVRLILSSNDATSCLIYGAQLEAGSYPTSYIPTSGTTVTRLADTSATTGLSDVIGQTEGTIFVDVDSSQFSSGSYISISNGTTNIRQIFGFEGGGNTGALRLYGFWNGFSYSNFAKGEKIKIALAYKNNDFALYVNGTQAGTNTGATISGTLSQFAFNSGDNAQNYQGNVYQAQLYKTRLTNAELATLTTI